jgi:minor extracellular protease Epr
LNSFDKLVISTIISSGLLISTFIPTMIKAEPISHEKFLITLSEQASLKGEIKERVKNKMSRGKVKHDLVAINELIVEDITPDEINALKADLGVKSVEKDISIFAYDSQDWGLDMVNAPKAWSLGLTGKGVKVALMDTGIDLSHPDLSVAGGVSMVDSETSYQDGNGHGTHVAGIIGARNNGLGTIGVAPDAQLYAVKVLTSSGSGTLSDLVEGIDWAINNQMNIINMSLGTPTYTDAMAQAVDRAYVNGLILVGASGNGGNLKGTGDSVEYPANLPNVIAVAAVDSTLNRASFSATGSE